MDMARASGPPQPPEFAGAYYRVAWREPAGRVRWSRTCSTLDAAEARAGRHPWPWTIVQVEEAWRTVKTSADLEAIS